MRLNREAEGRGSKRGVGGLAVGEGEGEGDGEGEDDRVAREVRGQEDEYYDLVAQTSLSRKAAKQSQASAAKAARAASSLVRVSEEQGAGGKRAIGYTIEKNKGLAPKRKKEVRNPRVKKRMKFEERKRKLASTRAVYGGGEEKGGYAGEKTGIKKGLVKSVKL